MQFLVNVTGGDYSPHSSHARGQSQFEGASHGQTWHDRLGTSETV